MSDQDDTLLDEDLGDEEYDLGNDEEEALLADDYEIDRQNNYKGEEETDDVLDLGVTDALDDLEGEDDNVEYRNETDNQTHCYNDERVDNHGNYYDEHHHSYEEHGRDIEMQQNTIIRGDLREKLQKNVQRDNVGNGQIVEEDDCEDARERRNRFQAERIMISPKMNNDIPDSLESVVTAEQSRPIFRGRGRGRGMRGIRGGRYLQNMGNFHQRFMVRAPMFEDQKQQYRPPLLEPRPPMFQNGPSNHMNPQMIYHHENPFQHFPQGVTPRGPRPPFEETRQFNPNQFPGGMHPPRPQNPQMDYRPRGPMPGNIIPRFNGPPNPAFMQNQHFQRPQLEQEMPGRQMMPPGSMMQPGPPIPGNQGPPMHPSHPGMPPAQSDGSIPAFRPPGPNQIPHPHQNAPMPGQPGFEPRPQFQGPPYEGRNMYDGRPPYGNQPPVGQFNPQPQHGPHQQHQSAPNVPIPQGHKILINPHFRGNVQPQNDGRLAWDNSQQPPVIHPQGPNDQFGQNPTYPGQPLYNPPSAQEGSQDYQKNYPQNKNDDPYAYFSDVWQENKTKPRSMSPSKNYSGDNNYSRDNSYKDYDKYKSDSRDSYLDDQRYRDRSPPPRSRDPPRSRPPPQSNHYHSDSYDQRQSRPANSSSRPLARAPQKRTPEPQDRSGREISPKRTRLNRDSQESRASAFNAHHNNVKEAEMDPEEREYRKKMEEQKRLREKILQEKENRRKQAALEKQSDESKDSKNYDHAQQEKDTTENSNVKLRMRTGAGQATESEKPTSLRIVRTVQTTEKNNSAENHNAKDSAIQQEVQKKPMQTATRRVVIQKQLPNARVATTIQKTVSNLQKSQAATNAKNLQQKVSTDAVVKKVTLALQKNAASGVRTVVGERAGTLRKVVVSDTTTGNIKKIIGTVQSNRVVLPKPVQVKKTADGKSTTILIENLAMSTTETQIRRMCQGIGTLESIVMGEGTATVVFKTHSAAMVFHKKYQRKVIDSSTINVKFLPQSGSQLITSS